MELIFSNEYHETISDLTINCASCSIDGSVWCWESNRKRNKEIEQKHEICVVIVLCLR